MLGPLESARRERDKQQLAVQYSFDINLFENPSSVNNDDEPYIPGYYDLLSINEEIRAWLHIPGTKVDYPILHTEDNDYYLTHNYKKEKAAEGAIFFDCMNKMDGTDKVLVAYGHNMRDKSMLASIKDYKNEAFYQQNKYMYMDTDFAAEKYEVLSVFTQNVDPNLGDVFKYNKLYFDSDQEFIDHINQMRDKSFYQTNAPKVTADSKILVLQTCTNGTGIYNNDRFIVVGIKVN